MTEQDSKKHKKRSSKHSKKKSSAAAQHALLKYAAMGKGKKLQKLLKGHPQADLDAVDSRGDTALHHACRGNHSDVARILLRYGADINKQNADGDTAAHLAATLHNLNLLTVLLQADPAPDIDLRDGHGVKVSELADAVLDEEDARSWEGQPGEEDMSPEEAWRQRLVDEAGAAGDFGGGFGETYDAAGTTADAEGWDAWAGEDWRTPRASTTQAQEHRESEDEFAHRIWREMEHRKARQQQSISSAFEEERKRAAEQRRAAESAAYERSRKTLEEEIGKDRAWRRAVESGGAATKRAQYEAKWRTFVTSTKDASIAFNDIPWPATGALGEDVKTIILYGTAGPAEERKRLRLELLRWHPDKFAGAFSARLACGDEKRIMERVTQISAYLNSLS